MEGFEQAEAARLVVDEARGLGVRLWVEDGKLRFRAPEGSMTDSLKNRIKASREAVVEALSGEPGPGVAVPRPDERHLPFPLTDVQSAYLLGRGEAVEGGGVSCHAYFELDMGDVDVRSLEAAFRGAVARYDALRTSFDEAGFQQVLPYEDVEPPDVEAVGGPGSRLLLRSRMSHLVHDASRPPLMSVALSDDGGERTVHASVDFLVADWNGIMAVLEDIASSCNGMSPEPPAARISFRDYVLAAASDEASAERDRLYWSSRLEEFAEPSGAPLSGRAWGKRFERLHFELGGEDWGSLVELAGRMGVSPSALLLGIYAKVVSAWTESPRPPIVVTLFDRRLLHEDVPLLVGDFTSTGLVSMDCSAASLADLARDARGQLADVLDHRAYSGVKVMRDVAREHGQNPGRFPFVFTSAVAADRRSEFSHEWAITYGITQTPQVGVDFQAATIGGGLHVNWDVREGVFADGVVEAMFGAYEGLVRAAASGALSEGDPLEVGVPGPQALARRERQSAADAAVPAPLPGGLLQDGLLEAARRDPSAVAVSDGSGETTYGELAGRARSVAAALALAGARPGDRVGVSLPKSAAQVAAVLGALEAGCCYVPVDPLLPEARKASIAAEAGLSAVVCAEGGAGWAPGAAAVPADPPAREWSPGRRADPSEPAYVIFTSGSTGAPRGVVVSHAAAKNTVEDVAARFGLCGADVALGVSGLGFDLSVFDLFGVLGRGGRLVLVDQGAFADPARWLEAAGREGATVWNSAPAQMSMVLDAAPAGSRALSSLRLALLSGDWVPVDVLARLAPFAPGAAVVALGGATEAAIWSNFHVVREGDEAGPSIPYGVALSGQRMDVLDAALRPRPDLAVGEICIAGAGLAEGYLGRPELTQERFVEAPGGERWYRTGDLGRWLPCGEVEFLGRRDTQVKIRGNRVELAEVEAAAKQLPRVADACAVLVNGGGLGAEIALCVRPRRNEARLEAMFPSVEKAAAVAGSILQGGKGADPLAFAVDGILYRFLLAFRKHGAQRQPSVLDLSGSSDEVVAERLLSISGFDCRYSVPDAGNLGGEAGGDPRVVGVAVDPAQGLPTGRGCFDFVILSGSDDRLLEAGGALATILAPHSWAVSVQDRPEADGLRGTRPTSAQAEALRLGTGARMARSLSASSEGSSRSLTILVFDDGYDEVPPEEVRGELEKVLPSVEVPRFVFSSGRFPLTRNGKVDRKAIAEQASSARSSMFEGSDPGDDRLGIMAVVESVLERTGLALSDNLLAAGADSLSLARIIAKIREGVAGADRASFDVYLRAVLDEPFGSTLSRIAEDGAAHAPRDAQERVAEGATVFAGKEHLGSPDGIARVVVHTAIGDFEWLRPLIGELSEGCGDPVVGVAPEPEWYLRQDHADLVGVCAERYAESISQLGVAKVQIVGFCIGGIVAAAMSSSLEAAGVEVVSTVVLDSMPLTAEIDDEMFTCLMFANAMGLGPQALGLGAAELAGAAKAFSGEADAQGDPDAAAFAKCARAFSEEGESARMERFSALSENTPNPLGPERMISAYRMFSQSFGASSGELPTCFGDVLYLKAQDQSAFLPGIADQALEAWDGACLGELDVREVPGNHFSMIARPNVSAVVREMNRAARNREEAGR